MAWVRGSLSGPIVRLAAVPASVGFGQTAFLSLIPTIAMQTGLGLAAIGAAAAAGTMAFLLAAPFCSRHGKRFGRRRMLLALAGLVFGSHALLLYTLAAGPQDAIIMFGLLAATRLTYGAGASGLLPTAQAWATELVPPERKTGVLGLLGMFGGVGRVLGAATASLGLLVPLAPFVVLAASPLLVTLVPADRDPPAAQPTAPARHLFPLDRRAALAVAIGFLLTFGATQTQIALGPRLAAQLGLGPEQAAAEVGVLLALAAVTMIVVQGAIAAWSPRNPHVLAIAGAVGVIGGAVLFVAAGSRLAFAAATILGGIGFGLAGPAAAAWLAASIAPQDRAPAFGWLASAQVCGQAVGALAGGLLFELRPDLPFVGTALAGLMVGSLASAALVRARLARRRGTESARTISNYN